MYLIPPKPVYAPLLIVGGLIAVSLFPIVNQSKIVVISVITATFGLIGWYLYLYSKARLTLKIEFLARKQHYIQASVQFSLFLYWGYFWRPVYDHLPLILAQLLFAYAFDLLLSWSRRRTYVLGFGPFPIIFSINLFMLFKPEWFYLQFIMIAVGLLGKEFIRWQRDGRLVHIFNPSAFALGGFSLLLIFTGTTDLTWGPEIASTLTLAPNIYVFLFLIGLVVMYFFSITLVAMTAAATLFSLSAVYSLLFDVPYFIDSEIPAAVFLGLHLLITDPSTSPRSLVGKTLFGVGYGLGVFALYSVLSSLGVPTFYDKLLCVPILNLCVIAIDRFVARYPLSLQWSLPKINLALMAVWMILFAGMTALNKTDGYHIGDSLPFWQHACAENKKQGCERLRQLEESYCADGSAWACNELAIQLREGDIVDQDLQLSTDLFARACQLRFAPACQNLLNNFTGELSSDNNLASAPPKTLDFRLMLREGGKNLMDMDEQALYRRACQHGWVFACAQEASL